MQSILRLLSTKYASLFSILIIVTSYLFFNYELDRANFTMLISVVLLLFVCAYQLVYFSNIELHKLFCLGVFFRLLLLLVIPNLSQDFYRFIWDGRMLFNGFNPYMSTPKILLEQGLQPVRHAQELFDGMGDLNASHYTNYPPVSQFCYWVAALFGSKSILISVVALRLQIILADIGIYFFGRKILKHLQFSEKNILLYFLNPFVIIELTGNLHFEAVMAFFLVWSCYLLLKHKWIAAAFVLSLSVSTKLIPLLFLPVFFYFFNASAFPVVKGAFNWKNIGQYATFCAIVIGGLLLTFVPFLSKALIENYSATVGLWFTNFEFNASVYYVIRWLGFQFVGWNIIGTVGKILPLVVFVSIILVSLYNNTAKDTTLFTALLFSICTYLLFSTTVHPWYVVIPLILSVFTNYRFILLWSFTMFFSYSAYSYNGFNEQLSWVFLEYVLVISFFVYEFFFKKKEQQVII